VALPPLRDRAEDIPLLIEFFFRRYTGNETWHSENIAPDAMKMLLDYPFPGNVRELENLVERAVVLGENKITVGSLPLAITGAGRPEKQPEVGLLANSGVRLEELLDSLERQYLESALQKCDGVKKRAAEMLGLSFRSFRYRLAKFGMDDEFQK
jgi:two-component system response regulator PilR (NtrC family)